MQTCNSFLLAGNTNLEAAACPEIVAFFHLWKQGFLLNQSSSSAGLKCYGLVCSMSFVCYCFGSSCFAWWGIKVRAPTETALVPTKRSVGGWQPYHLAGSICKCSLPGIKVISGFSFFQKTIPKDGVSPLSVLISFIFIIWFIWSLSLDIVTCFY